MKVSKGSLYCQGRTKIKSHTSLVKHTSNYKFYVFVEPIIRLEIRRFNIIVSIFKGIHILFNVLNPQTNANYGHTNP